MHSLTIRQLIKRCLSLVLISAVLWLVFGIRSHSSTEHHVVVSRRQPRAVWDFVADLNHLRIINPFLKDIEIVEDGSIYPAWHYSAILTEDLPTLGTVHTHAQYVVKPSGENYIISASTYACKLLCVKTESTMTFRAASAEEESPGTEVSEVLDIQSPLLLSWIFDTSSIANTRKARLENIKRHLEMSA